MAEGSGGKVVGWYQKARAAAGKTNQAKLQKNIRKFGPITLSDIPMSDPQGISPARYGQVCMLNFHFVDVRNFRS
jgi:hypothetical protein